MSLREQILGADDRPFLDVPTPEWPVKTVRIATLSGADRDLWEADIVERKKAGQRALLGNFSAALIVRCAVDPANGERIFREEDVAALGRKAAAPIQRLFDAACKLNGIGEREIRAAEKNLSGDPAGASPTA
jgi:hypothetical protein